MLQHGHPVDACLLGTAIGFVQSSAPLTSHPLLHAASADRSRNRRLLSQSAAFGHLIVAAMLFNSMYCFAWDVRMDWGLAQAGSKRCGLRNTLLISHEHPWPYYTAIAADFLLRLTWLARLRTGWGAYTDVALVLELVEVSGVFVNRRAPSAGGRRGDGWR